MSNRISLETDRSSGPARSTPLWITTVPARYFLPDERQQAPVVQAVSDGSVAVDDDSTRLEDSARATLCVLRRGCSAGGAWLQCEGRDLQVYRTVCMYKYGCMYVYRWMRKVAGDERACVSLPRSLSR